MSQGRMGIVVGFDSSPESQAAIDWGAAEAVRRQEPLKVVYATGWREHRTVLLGSREEAEKAARKVAENGAARAREQEPGLSVEAILELEGPAAALQKHSDTASLVVVGHRGYGRLSGALLGSVAFAISAHARSPVVVVRGNSTNPPGPQHPVVVGVDGSQDSTVALDQAVDIATRLGAGLRIVMAFESPTANPWNAEYFVNVNWLEEAIAEERKSATEVVDQAAERVRDKQPHLDVEPIVMEGRPDEVLGEASTGAGLLVVGARGRGDLASLLLGSVSRGSLYRANCPVRIVR